MHFVPEWLYLRRIHVFGITINVIFRILKAKSYFHLSDYDKAAALLERIPVIDTPIGTPIRMGLIALPPC